jgi:hypothetical protein
MAMRRTCTPEKQFDSGTGLQTLRASEPGHAGLISHASGVRLASPQPIRTSSPGWPLRSRRRSEKPDTHVRLVLLAPNVTVAEWLRRQTVDLSTRVQFPPVTPTLLGGRPAARTRVFEACYGSSSLPLPASTIMRASFNGPGHPATNRESGGSSPPARAKSQTARRPIGQGAVLRRLRFRFDSERADQCSGA